MLLSYPALGFSERLVRKIESENLTGIAFHPISIRAMAEREYFAAGITGRMPKVRFPERNYALSPVGTAGPDSPLTLTMEEDGDIPDLDFCIVSGTSALLCSARAFEVMQSIKTTGIFFDHVIISNATGARRV